MDQAVKDQAVKDDAVKSASPPAPAKGIQVTENALKKIRSAMVKENVSPEQGGLRLGVQGGGCSGLSYNVRYQERSRDAHMLSDGAPEGATRAQRGEIGDLIKGHRPTAYPCRRIELNTGVEGGKCDGPDEPGGESGRAGHLFRRAGRG